MAETYNLVEYDSDEERCRHPIIAASNLASATVFITDLLQRNSIQYALMGGFACQLLKSPRLTRDIDVAFQGPKKMLSLWNVVEKESRLVIPNTKKIAGVMKVFVKTGPGFDGCQDRINVEVDLIENGTLGSPVNIEQHHMAVAMTTGSGQRTVHTLDILYMLRSKMGAHAARRTARDRDDILYILGAYTDNARAVRSQLNPDDVRSFLSALSSANKQRWTEFFGLS